MAGHGVVNKGEISMKVVKQKYRIVYKSMEYIGIRYVVQKKVLWWWSDVQYAYSFKKEEAELIVSKLIEDGEA